MTIKSTHKNEISFQPSRRALLAATPALVMPFAQAQPPVWRQGEVATVRGPVLADQLGTTLMHEHLMPWYIPEGKDPESLASADWELAEADRVGINTVVDLTPTRNAVHYKSIASRTPVNIVVCTGCYTKNNMPANVQAMSENQLYDMMMKDLQQGIEGTDVRPGIIKVAAGGAVMTSWETAVFRAAARVQKDTGVPIATHATFAARTQFDLLRGRGANPAKLFFSHVEAKFGWQGRTRQQMADYLATICRDGGSLLFNNFGYEFDTPWVDLVYLLRTLCDRGHATKILVSADYFARWIDGKIVRLVEDVHPTLPKKSMGYMIMDAVPALLKAGFSAAEIRTFMVDNPRRFLCGVA